MEYWVPCILFPPSQSLLLYSRAWPCQQENAALRDPITRVTLPTPPHSYLPMRTEDLTDRTCRMSGVWQDLVKHHTPAPHPICPECQIIFLFPPQVINSPEEKFEITYTRDEEKYHGYIHVWIFSTKHTSPRVSSHIPRPLSSLTPCREPSVLANKPETQAWPPTV